MGNVDNALAQNYRKSSPSTRFGTPQLVHALITISVADCTDYNTVDGEFYHLVTIIQKFAEIYAIGEVQYGEGGSSVTVILKADTVTDPDYSNNGQYDPQNAGSRTLAQDLTAYFENSASVNYTTMYGLQYD